MAALVALVLYMAAVASANLIIAPSNSSAAQLLKSQLRLTSPEVPSLSSLPTSFVIAPLTSQTGQGHDQASVDVCMTFAFPNSKQLTVNRHSDGMVI